MISSNRQIVTSITDPEVLLPPESITRMMHATAKFIRKHASSSTNPFAPTNPESIRAEIFRTFEAGYRISKVDIGSGRVDCIVLDSDQIIAYMSHSTDIMMVEIKTIKVSYAFENAHQGPICAMVLLKGKNMLVSSSADKTIKIWDLVTRQLYCIFYEAHNAEVSCLALTSNENYLVSGSHDNSIKIWDLTQNKCIKAISEAHKEHIYAVTITKNGQRIISAGMDKAIRIWDFESLRNIHSFKYAHYSGIVALQLSEDNDTLFSSCGDGLIKSWDLIKLEPIHLFANAHTSAVGKFVLTGRSRFLLSVSRDCSMSVCDVEQKTHLHSFRGFGTEPLVSLAITDDERVAFATGLNGSLYFVRFSIKAQQTVIKTPHTKLIVAIQITWDDKFLVTGSDDGTIQVWDLQRKSLEHIFEKPGESKVIWNLDISKDNQWIVSVCSDGEIDLWSLSDKDHVLTYNKISNTDATAAIFTNRGDRVIAFLRDTSICVFSAVSSMLLAKLKSPHTDITFTMTVTEDDKYLISGSADKSISIWDLERMESSYVIENAHDAMIWKVVLTQKDKKILSSSSDGTIKLWDLQSREVIHVFKTIKKTEICALTITKDDRFAITIDNCGVMEILNLKTKQQAYINRELENVLCLSVCLTSKNEKVIVSGDTSIFIIANPFNELTVQHSLDCNPYTLMRFMPFTNYFFKKNSKYRKSLISSYPELTIHPQGWNWLHIVAIFSPEKELVEACFENGVLFATDITQKTPLHYLFENKDNCIDSINIVLQKFDQIIERCQKPSALLKTLSDLFCKILRLDNQFVANFLRLCIENSESTCPSVQDIYGEIKSNQDIGFHHADSINRHEEIKELLVRESFSQKVSIKALPFNWDYCSFSEDMMSIVRTLKVLKYPGIFETEIVSRLIQYLWSSSRNLYYFLGCVFSIQAIMISASVTLEHRYVGVDIVIILLAAFLATYEISEAIADRKKAHSRSLWAYNDITTHLLIMVTFILVRTGLAGVAKDWLFSIILAMVYIRWISYFRVFKQTRKLIRLIIEVLLGIRSFAMVLLFIIVGLSLIFVQFDRETSYSTHLLNSYLLLYSHFNTDDIHAGQLAYLILVVALVSIVLLNMLIAIMQETFKEVEGRGVLVDSKELLDLIDETIDSKRFFDLLRIKKTYFENIRKKNYLFFVAKTMEEDGFKQHNEEKHVKELKEYITGEIVTLSGNLQLQMKHSFEDNVIAKLEVQEKKIHELSGMLMHQNVIIQEQNRMIASLMKSLAVNSGNNSSMLERSKAIVG